MEDFAVYTPNKNYEVKPEDYMTDSGYDVPLPPPIQQDEALAFTNALASRLFRLEAASTGRLKVVRTADELTRCLDKGIMAAIFISKVRRPLIPTWMHFMCYIRQAFAHSGSSGADQCLWGRCAVPLSINTRYRSRIDRSRQEACPGVQSARHHDRHHPSE